MDGHRLHAGGAAHADGRMLESPTHIHVSTRKETRKIMQQMRRGTSSEEGGYPYKALGSPAEVEQLGDVHHDASQVSPTAEVGHRCRAGDSAR